MKLAIVGTSQELNDYEKIKLRELILHELKMIKPTIVISGGAIGVDTTAKEICKEFQIPFDEFLPKTHTTIDYMDRNKAIARECDMVLCFSTVRIITKKCYHHTPLGNHQKTAGCYTRLYAHNLNKATKLILI